MVSGSSGCSWSSAQTHSSDTAPAPAQTQETGWEVRMASFISEQVTGHRSSVSLYSVLI